MLEALIEIVRRAGDMVLSAHDIQNVTREKHGPADLVTQYDEAVQAFLRRELLRLLPEADFFGEEGEHPALTRPWVFVVDPIDGTTNFTRRMNYSSISVALVHNGQTEYGVVYNPYVGELFAARRVGVHHQRRVPQRPLRTPAVKMKIVSKGCCPFLTS